jgi:protoporphyrinogen oxidase
MAPINARQERWAVVGGGFLGMTVALRLAQRGHSVTLYDAAPSLGGVASPWQLQDVVWDRHYHVILQSDSYLLSVLKGLHLEDEVQWAPARTGFYVDSRLYSLSNALEFLTFPPLNLFDKLRLGATVLAASRIKDCKPLEGIPVADWLEKWSGRHVLEKIWLPLLRAKLGDSYKETSAAFIWATIARMYAARRKGMKKEVFGYVSGGYARIIEQFTKVLKEQQVILKLGQPVRSVASTGPARTEVELANGSSESFHAAVMTTALPLAARACPQLTTAERDRIGRVKYQGIICASLLLKEPLSNFYITNITDDWVPFTAVIEMSSLVERRYFGGRSLVYLPKYLSSDASEFDLTDEQLQHTFMRALQRMYPRFKSENLLCFRVSRVKYLLPLQTLNYSDQIPGMVTSIPGVYLVSSAQIVNGTLNVNETIQLGERAVQRLSDLETMHFAYPDNANRTISETDRQPLAGCRQ